MEGFINKLKNNKKFRTKYNGVLELTKDSVENDIIGLKGLYFGYPKCCISYYIKNNMNLPETCIIASENFGFIPCIDCSQRILDKKIRLTKLIDKRFCKVSFMNYLYKDDNSELEKFIEHFLKLFESEHNGLELIEPEQNINQGEEENISLIYKFQNHSDLKHVTRYYPHRKDDIEFIKRITKINGKYWGYPLCCVKYFIENRGYCKKTETICDLSKKASENTGFYPCPIHAQHVIDKFIKLEDLIKKSRKTKLQFPQEDLTENGNYLMHVITKIN